MIVGLLLLLVSLIARVVCLVVDERNTPRGDVNRDGRVNAVDLTMMKRHLIGMYDLDSTQIRIGDMNHNHRIDQMDIDVLVEGMLR